MNIYTKLFVKEYTKNPYKNRFGYKHWYMNLSYYNYKNRHREFDLPSIIQMNNLIPRFFNSLFYYRYNKNHRLIGSAIIIYENIEHGLYGEKHYYINGLNADYNNYKRRYIC